MESKKRGIINNNKRLLLESKGYRLTYFKEEDARYIKDFNKYNLELSKEHIRKIKIFMKILLYNDFKEKIRQNKKHISIHSIRWDNDKFITSFMEFSLFKELREKNKKNNLSEFFNNISKEKIEDDRYNPYSRQIPSEIREEIFKRDNYTCKYCGWKNGIDGSKDKILTIDHIIPWTYGGTSKKENLTTSCFECNIKKNDKFLKSLIEKSFNDINNKDGCMINNN
ncbi:MAG: HNH endonuclease [Candidatus Omnitrophica bacterium]|jgi:hypothetical protein|nr:HNH endonuclease [Candidatus Omnitrophota bacterium]